MQTAASGIALPSPSLGDPFLHPFVYRCVHHTSSCLCVHICTIYGMCLCVGMYLLTCECVHQFIFIMCTNYICMYFCVLYMYVVVLYIFMLCVCLCVYVGGCVCVGACVCRCVCARILIFV